jgi:uncharacterized phiE125 gp8 family phage protein
MPAYGHYWPATLAGPGTVRISGTAGYGEGEAPELDQVALMLVAHMYHNRGDGQAEVPALLQRMLDPYRPIGLA